MTLPLNLSVYSDFKSVMTECLGKALEIFNGFLQGYGYSISFLEGKCDELTDGQVLKFLTGCLTLPQGGLGMKISVYFTSDQRYQAVSTCSRDMTLPLNLSVYRNFKSVMTEAIVSGQGFGNI